MSDIHDVKTGEIIIRDDGWGMDLDTILNCWLEREAILNLRSQQKAKRSPKGRLPIGEKGIGRFGVHKLGHEIELVTKKATGKEYVVRIDWNQFSHSKYLNDVPVIVMERETPVFLKVVIMAQIIKITHLTSHGQEEKCVE